MPLCFTSPRMFALWLEADLHMPKVQRCDGVPCVDCQPAYQLRMKKLGRCARPGTAFGIDQAGGVVGIPA
jgi:hypothetical protein